MELDLLLLRQRHGNTLTQETFFKSGRGVILSLSIIFSQCIITNANPDTAEAALEYIKAKTHISGGEERVRSKLHSVIHQAGAILRIESTGGGNLLRGEGP